MGSQLPGSSALVWAARIVLAGWRDLIEFYLGLTKHGLAPLSFSSHVHW